MKKLILAITLFVFLPLWAKGQESHWQCDPHAYEYDMTAYVTLELNDDVLTNLSNYEIAAFCGNECRGVAELMTAGTKQIGYLRIRSNTAAGEAITFKVYDKTEEKVITVQDTNVTFKSNDTKGTASAPFILDITKRFMSGDANDDGVVDALDVVLAISYYLGENVYLNFAAADVVADGEINALDVVAMQDIYLNTSNQANSPRKRQRKSKQ